MAGGWAATWVRHSGEGDGGVGFPFSDTGATGLAEGKAGLGGIV
jgi:hypothetical protein